MKLKIKELIKAHNKGKDPGERITSMYLGAILWPESSPKTQQVNISNLINNKRNSIDLERLQKLCDVFDCTPNEIITTKAKDNGRN